MVTEKKIEAAVNAVSENVDWVNALAGGPYGDATQVMRDALEAALSYNLTDAERAKLHSADAKTAWAECEALRARVAELEAALSTDAEPVGVRCTGCGSSWTDEDLAYQKSRRTELLSCCPERKTVPVYAAPPAPSVAVKALEWVDRHDKPLRENDLLAESVIGQYAIRPSSDGLRFRLWTPGMRHDDAVPHSTVESAKSAAQADYEARIRAALSAQVQDVAGWQDEDKLTPDEAWTILCETPDITSPEEYPDHALITFEQLRSYMERAHNPVVWQDISIAPRDGTKILMRGGVYHGVPFPGYWEQSPYASDRPWVSVINDSRLYEHVPTHWMPLPAAPAAKLEGKP